MRLSVIIPTLNEASELARALSSLPPETETIVADGSSCDGTADIARTAGARVVQAKRGRGTQMNLGARYATGDVLLFLHADCALGPRAAEAIREVLQDPTVIGGSFRLRIDDPRWGYRLVALGSNLRARFLGLPYGDQALFVRRSDFDAVGGYPEAPLMEDVVLVRRLRRRGTLARGDETVTTSSRHWRRLGPFLTTLVNWVTIAAFFAGVPASRLAPLYHRLRKGKALDVASVPSLAVPGD